MAVRLRRRDCTEEQWNSLTSLASTRKRIKLKKANSYDDLELVIAAVVEAGFLVPVREHRFHPTRKFRFDLAWPDSKVAFEREGGTWTGWKSRHTNSKGYRDDCIKYSLAASLGWLVIRATVDMIHDGTAAEYAIITLGLKNKKRKKKGK